MTSATFEVRARHQPREVLVAALVLAQQHEPARLDALAFVAQQRVDTDQRLDAARQRGAIELDEREQVPLIGQRDGRHAEPRHSVDQALTRLAAVVGRLALDARDAVDERVLGVNVQVDETRHAERASGGQIRSADCTGA